MEAVSVTGSQPGGEEDRFQGLPEVECYWFNGPCPHNMFF